MICWKNSFLLRPLTNPSSSACLWSKRFVRFFVLVAGICPDDVRCAPIMVPDDRSIAHRFLDVFSLICEALRCGLPLKGESRLCEQCAQIVFAQSQCVVLNLNSRTACVL